MLRYGLFIDSWTKLALFIYFMSYSRLKSDVAKALPPKRETLLYVGMTPMQRELYKSILMRGRATASAFAFATTRNLLIHYNTDVDAVLGRSGASSSTRLSNLIMHLRKACNHPYLFDGVYIFINLSRHCY
jgi:SNF2 family DNA or RNA helicase